MSSLDIQNLSGKNGGMKDSSQQTGSHKYQPWSSLTWNQDSRFTCCVEDIIDYSAGDFHVSSWFQGHGTDNIKKAWRSLQSLCDHFLLPYLSFAVQPNYLRLWKPSLGLAGDANALIHVAIDMNCRVLALSCREGKKQTGNEIFWLSSPCWKGLPQICP